MATFKLSTADYCYDDIGKLSKLGFVFNEKDVLDRNVINRKITPTIELTTIDELLKFVDEFGKVIIDNDNSLMICDSWVE